MLRVNTRISKQLNEWLDKYSEESGLPKSTLIFLAIENYRREIETMDKMSDLKVLIEELKKQGAK